MVECDLAKVEVAGSNPVSRSNLRSLARATVGKPCEGCPPKRRRREGGRGSFRSPLAFPTAPSPSGKAEVCKTSISGSNPDGASIFTKKISDLMNDIRYRESLNGPKLDLSRVRESGASRVTD